MWSYYGAKTKIVDLYPKPKHGVIVEPFCGSARYALRHFDKEVILIDKYPVVVNLWKWLQQCSAQDILSLPRSLPPGSRLEDIKFDCEEARNLTAFVYGCGDYKPRAKLTARKTVDRPNHGNYNLKRIASNLFKIRHWKVMEGDYTMAPNIEATWFVDPPYQFGGHVYIMSSKQIDFAHLGEWCKSREGQVIVCENTKATWLDFKPIKTQRGSLFTTTEAIWTNTPTIYDNQQLKLIA
jgi:hypothetical protein